MSDRMSCPSSHCRPSIPVLLQPRHLPEPKVLPSIPTPVPKQNKVKIMSKMPWSTSHLPLPLPCPGQYPKRDQRIKKTKERDQTWRHPSIKTPKTTPTWERSSSLHPRQRFWEAMTLNTYLTTLHHTVPFDPRNKSNLFCDSSSGNNNKQGHNKENLSYGEEESCRRECG